MADLDITGRVVVDASQAEGAFQKVGAAADKMSKDITGSAKKAGDAVDGIGKGSEQTAQQFTRSQARVRDEILRTTTSLQNLGKKASEKLELKINAKGLDPAQFAPYLAELRKVEAAQSAAAASATKTGSAFEGVGAAATIAARAVAAIGIGVSIGEFVRMADASTNVASRLGLVTTSAAELASVQQRLFQVAQSSRVSFVDLVGTYAQVARSTKDLGVSQTALLGVIQTISQAVTISGGSAASAQAALTQLSQGFASGALRGEELNSILEQTPRLAQALADGLGVGVGKLRELGQAGALTSEAVLGALEKSAAGVAAEFGKMAVTVEQSSTNAANSILKLVGAFDKLFGVTSSIAGTIQTISSGLDFLSKDVEKLGSQGPLRAAAQEVLRLDEYARNLRNGMKNGVFNPNAEAQLARVNAQLAEAKARFRDLDQQLSGVKDPRDQTGFSSRSTSYANEEKRLAKLREDANKFRLDQAGVPTSYLKDMAELIRLNQAGVIVGKEYNDALKKQQDILLQKTGVTKGAAAAANQEQNAYETLVASIRTKIAANEAEISGAGRLTESDKLRIKLQEELAVGAKTLTAEHKARALALLDILGAQEKEEARIKGLVAAYKQEAETAEEIAQAYTAQSKAREAGRAGVDAYANGIDESNKSLQLELSLMGQSEQARSVALEQYRIELDLKKQLAAINENIGFNEVQREEERAKARAAAAIATANASSRAFLDEWKQSVDKYDDIFRQGFADMLNNGEDGWKSFTRSLATTFKTTVADQIYKMFAQPFVMKLVASLIGITGGGIVGTAASAVSGGSNILSTASSGLGLVTGAFGQGFRAGISGLLGEAGLGGTISAGTTAIGAGNIAGGLGTLAGPLALVGGGILALTSIIKATKGETRTGGQFGVAFDGSVTNNRRGETYTYQGQQFDRDFSNGERNALINGQAYRLEGDPVAQESAIRDAVSGTASGINAFLKALGSAATVTGFSAGLETSGKGRGGVFAGGTLSDGTTFGESGKGDNYAGTLYEKFSTNSPDFKQALADFTLDLKQSTIQALQSVTDIPESIKKALKDVDAEGLSEEAANALLESINAQIVGVGQLKDAFDAMGMEALAGIAFDAAAGLAEVSGGFDALLGNLNTYYSNFFSPEEQRANIERQLTEAFSDLDLSLPDIDAQDARAQYRALVEAASKDLSEEGQKTYATLLQLAGAFAGVTNAAGDAATALLKTQADLRSTAFSALERAIAAEKNVLQAQIDIAQDVASTMGDLFDLLHDNVRELYAEVDSTRGFQAEQGNQFIAQALAAARTSGYLPDADQLAEAIAGARSGFDSGNYSSQFELDRDRLVLAGRLAGLEEITGKQLTDAQRTVKELEGQTEQLDETLEYWREQIDIANGTYEATLSVADAIKELTKLTFPDKYNTKPLNVSSAASSGGAVFGGTGGGAAPATFTINSAGLRTYSDGSTYQLTESELDLYRRGLLGKVPAFDVGTDYVPRDMLAMVHEGEKIVPKAYNPAANPGMGGSGQTEMLLTALLEQNVRLETRLAAIEGHTQDTSRATNGNPTAPVPMALVEDETV